MTTIAAYMAREDEPILARTAGKVGIKRTSTCFKICYGLCFPLTLVCTSLYLYLVPCIASYWHRTVGLCCFKLWSSLCSCVCSCKFTDTEFKPDSSSLGKWHDKAPNELDSEVVWKRGDEIIELNAAKHGKKARKRGEHAKLFAHGIDTDDIAQGQLGDCWLLSAIACLAEFPGAIEKVFVTREYSYRGKYTVQLYSGKKLHAGTPQERDEGWVTLTVDDLFPCGNQSGEPIFAQIGKNSEALWVLILEKAFAKFCGTYCGLDGGHPVWALQAMTGDHVRRYMADGSSGDWQGYDICHKEDEEHPRRMGIRKMKDRKGKGEAKPSLDRFFDIIREYDDRDSVIAAGSMQGKDDVDNSKKGIVQGHAYTIKAVKEVKSNGQTFKLLQLRNPWGKFEWEGDWGDNSKLWAEHKSVASALKFTKEEDGMFWMSWQDFQLYFDQVDICHRSVDVNELYLDVHEDQGFCGPCQGCVLGCGEYWCMCKGAYLLLCPEESSEDTVEVHKGCCAKCKRAIKV